MWVKRLLLSMIRAGGSGAWNRRVNKNEQP